MTGGMLPCACATSVGRQPGAAQRQRGGAVGAEALLTQRGAVRVAAAQSVKRKREDACPEVRGGGGVIGSRENYRNIRTRERLRVKRFNGGVWPTPLLTTVISPYINSCGSTEGCGPGLEAEGKNVR